MKMVVPFLQFQSPGGAICLRFRSFAGNPGRTAHSGPDETGSVDNSDDESRHMQWGFHKSVATQKQIASKDHQKTKKYRKTDVQSFVLCMGPPIPRDCEGKTAIDKQGEHNSDEPPHDEEKRSIGSVGHAPLSVLHTHKILRTKEIAHAVKKIDASGDGVALLLGFPGRRKRIEYRGLRGFRHGEHSIEGVVS